MPISIPTWEEHSALVRRVEQLEQKCEGVAPDVPTPPVVPTPLPPVEPPVPTPVARRGGNFWIGGPPQSIDGAIPGKWWFHDLQEQANVRHLRDTWGINHFRLNLHPESAGQREPLDGVLRSVITEGCIPLIDLHVPTGRAPSVDEVEQIWGSTIWPAISQLPKAEQQLVQFSPANEPFQHGDIDVRERWLKFHREAFWKARLSGFEGVLVANAPWWGQDRESADMPVENSVLLNEGALLVDEFGGREQVGLDVHTYSYWDPMWRDDNPVTVEWMLDYFEQLATTTDWPIIGEYGGPIPTSIARTPAALGWSNQTIALPDYGAALKLGLAMAEDRWPDSVSHHLWHMSRMTSRLHYNQDPIPGTDAANNGWPGKRVGLGSGQLFLPDEVDLTPLGEIHLGRLETVGQHWQAYAGLTVVHWH